MGPSSPAYRHTAPTTEIEETEMPQPEEVLPQPQMQRLWSGVQHINTVNPIQWEHPSLQTVLQEASRTQAAPLHLHGLASRIGTLAYETSLISRRNRPEEEQEYVSSPRFPARRQEPQTLTPSSNEPAVMESVSTRRRRDGHIDELLKTPAYAGTMAPKEIVNLLRERMFRMAAFYILSQEPLRTDARLLSLVAETIYLDMRSRTSGKPHDLAIRLGWTSAGAQRGPAREALHQKMVIQQGRLPSIKEVEKAVMKDNFDPHGRFDAVPNVNNVLQDISSVMLPDLALANRTRQDWTLHYNQQLHDQILGGAKANQTRKDGQKAFRHCRPTGGLNQLSALLHKIQELKHDRGFQPDWVTVNLVVKTWLRGLAAGPQKSPFGVDDIFKAFKKTLTMDSVRKQKLNFDRDIQPLTKMLVKALKTNGEWLKAREVLAWMAEIRETIAALAEAEPKPDITDGNLKPKRRSSPTQDSKRSRSSPDPRSVETASDMDRSEINAGSNTSAPQPASRERIISMKHFEIAMQEITPSSSESGNLPELRKVSRPYLVLLDFTDRDIAACSSGHLSTAKVGLSVGKRRDTVPSLGLGMKRSTSRKLDMGAFGLKRIS